MIELSNGHKIEFANASGALGFDGRGYWWEQPLRWLGILDPKAFSIVSKTVTMNPREGNLNMCFPWECVQPVRYGPRYGYTNAVGLTNPGIHKWIERDYTKAKSMGYGIAVSVWPDTVGEAEVMAGLLEPLELTFIELNLSCPNVPHESSFPYQVEIVKSFYHLTEKPLVLKLAESQVRSEFIKPMSEYVDVFHAINAIPWDEVFPSKKPSPIAEYKHGQKGAVSGQHIRNRALAAVQKLVQMTERPVIGGGGIWNVEDVELFRRAGASAFSIGSLFLCRPWRPNRIVREWNRRQLLVAADDVVSAAHGEPTVSV